MRSYAPPDRRDDADKKGDRSKRQSPGRSPWIAVGFVALMSISAYFGFEVQEFGASVDGVGYGHMGAPTYVTALVSLCAGVAIVAPGWGMYRNAIPIWAGGALTVVFWFPVMLAGFATLPWHYDHLCETLETPSACASVSWDCEPDGDEKCRQRRERACRLGHTRTCDQMVERGEWSEQEVCDALSETCERARECAIVDHPRHCNADAVPGYEAFLVSETCSEVQERCSGE